MALSVLTGGVGFSAAATLISRGRWSEPVVDETTCVSSCVFAARFFFFFVPADPTIMGEEDTDTSSELGATSTPTLLDMDTTFFHFSSHDGSSGRDSSEATTASGEPPAGEGTSPSSAGGSPALRPSCSITTSRGELLGDRDGALFMIFARFLADADPTNAPATDFFFPREDPAPVVGEPPGEPPAPALFVSALEERYCPQHTRRISKSAAAIGANSAM